MFDFGLSYTDWRKIVWTFVQAALAYMIATAADWLNGNPWSWKAVVIAALAAGVSAVKNFVLADSSPLK